MQTGRNSLKLANEINFIGGSVTILANFVVARNRFHRDYSFKLLNNMLRHKMEVLPVKLHCQERGRLYLCFGREHTV